MSKLVIRNLDSHSIVSIDDRSYFLEFIMTKQKELRIYKNKNQFFNPQFKETKEKFISNKNDFELIEQLTFKKQIDKNSEEYSGFKFTMYNPRKPIFMSHKFINPKYNDDIKLIQNKYANYCKLHKIDLDNIKIKLDLPFEIGYKKNEGGECKMGYKKIESSSYTILVPASLSRELSDNNTKELVNYCAKQINKKDQVFVYTIEFI